MELRVGEIKAQCPSCKGTEFRAPPGERAGPYMKYACTGCGGSWTYARLIGQIGRETLKRRNGRPAAAGDMTRSVPYFLRRNS